MALLPEGITELLHHKMLPLPLVRYVVLMHFFVLLLKYIFGEHIFGFTRGVISPKLACANDII